MAKHPEYIEREKEHLDKHERCKNCYHLSSCDAWVKHGTILYDDYKFSVENCPYYISTTDVIEKQHGEWIVTENGCVIHCSKCVSRLELCYPDGTEVRNLPHCPYCGAKIDGKDEGNATD